MKCDRFDVKVRNCSSAFVCPGFALEALWCAVRFSCLFWVHAQWWEEYFAHNPPFEARLVPAVVQWSVFIPEVFEEMNHTSVFDWKCEVHHPRRVGLSSFMKIQEKHNLDSVFGLYTNALWPVDTIRSVSEKATQTNILNLWNWCKQKSNILSYSTWKEKTEIRLLILILFLPVWPKKKRLVDRWIYVDLDILFCELWKSCYLLLSFLCKSIYAEILFCLFLFKENWPQVALSTDSICPLSRRLAAEMQKPLFSVCVSKMTKKPHMQPRLVLPCLPPFFHFPLECLISCSNPLLTLIFLFSLFLPPCFRLTGWRWVVWAKHPWLCHVGQTVHFQQARIARRTLSAPSRLLPSCSRKSSSSQSRLRSSRRPGMTMSQSTSNWPTMLTNSKAHASSRWD